MPEKEPSLWADVDGDFEEYQRVALRGNGVTDWLQERSTTRVGRWEQAARAGYARGMVLLGECYEKGFGGVPQDEKQAVEWYRKAAEAGNALAMYNLGWMYAKGRGVPQDEKQAVEWLHKAAQAGHPLAPGALKKVNQQTSQIKGE